MAFRIIPRSEWGAKYGYGPHTRQLGNLEKWLHHSVTVAPDTVAPFTDDYAAIRTIEKIGHQRFGSYGFPYTFAFTPAGLIFEGHPIDRVGAHTQGHNTAGAGFVLVGNYENMRPTTAQREAIAWTLRHGVERGWWKTPGLNGGHRDTKSTACPGRYAYAEIGEINRLAAAGGVQLVNRPVPTSPAQIRLDVDGKWGSDTTTALQVVFNLPIKDGIVSRQAATWEDDNPGLTTGWQWLTSGYDAGSPTIRALQEFLKAKGFYTGKLDGLIGPQTIAALQGYLASVGAYTGSADGEIWKPSTTVEALQRRLNTGRL